MSKKKAQTKRKLTEAEIDDILSFIEPNPHIPSETAEVVVRNAKKTLRDQLVKIEIYPTMISKLKEKVRSMYSSTLIQPGESVGIITAQSIGEKQTQSNLNSVDWKEKIMILENKKPVITEIGKFIDSLLKKTTKNLEYFPENRTEYLHTQDMDMFVPSCDKDGKTNWYRVEAVTRHLPVGKLVKVKTQYGRTVTATQAKSFLVWNGTEFVDKNGSEISIGDFLPTTKSLEIPHKNNTVIIDGQTVNLTYELGKAISQYLSGNLQETSSYYTLVSYICKDDTVPPFCYTSNKDFVEGIIHNLSKYLEGDIACHIRFLATFIDVFPTDKNMVVKNDVILDKIIDIEYLESSTPYVYDLTVEKTRNFQLWNGLNVRDTFHKAGSSDKQPVVSKFSELLNTTNKPKAPSYIIYFKKGNDTVQNLRQTISHSLVHLTFKKITKNFTISTNKEPEPWYEAFYTLYGEKDPKFTDCISLDINMDILYEYKLKMEEIAHVISQEYEDMFCMFSPDCFGKMDIYIDTTNIELPEKKLIFVTEENCKEIYLEEVVQPVLEHIIIGGIPGITNMFFVKDRNEWYVETENSYEKVIETHKFKNKNSTGRKEKFNDSTKRFKKVLSHDNVDMSRTVSNNVWDIYHTLGVEATRQYMIDEFSTIMEGINTCHVMLLVDKMTFTGSISSISRYTMRREESGPFGKASFEETLDNFLKAGVFGQEEPTRGVSASIICGKKAPIGTGLCDISIDIKKLAMNAN
jgi:DNA-directed RNA polymerase beta' subunit